MRLTICAASTLCMALLSTNVVFAAHLSFDLNDLNITGSLASRRVYVIPESTPKAAGGEVITSDIRTFVTNTNGNYTLSNVVAGVYRVEVVGPSASPPGTPNTKFRIEIPEDSAAILEVDTIIKNDSGFLKYNAHIGAGGRLKFDT